MTIIIQWIYLEILIKHHSEKNWPKRMFLQKLHRHPFLLYFLLSMLNIFTCLPKVSLCQLIKTFSLWIYKCSGWATRCQWIAVIIVMETRKLCKEKMYEKSQGIGFIALPPFLYDTYDSILRAIHKLRRHERGSGVSCKYTLQHKPYLVK